LIRDNALAVSGLLDPTQFGRPTYPSQPEGLWKDVSFNKFSYPQKTESSQLYRRSLYTFWRRTLSPPNMFDAAKRQMCSVKPSRTNTPLQSLTLMNDPIYIKAALTLAKGATDATDPLVAIFKKVTSRIPSEREKTILQRSYKRELSHFESDQDAAQALTESEGEEAPRLAALTLIAQMALNLDESITKE